jgi:hypothetical protein
MTRGDAYAAFLSSTDLGTWEASLEQYADLAELGDPAEPRALKDLGQAICIAIYALWLAGLRGDRDARARLRDRHAELVAAAGRSRRHADTPEARLAMAAAAASGGYDAVALALFGVDDAPVELAVLMMPDTPEKRAALLKPKLAALPAPGFLPAVYFHAHALLDLGYLNECRREIEAVGGPAQDNSLVLDLAAKLAEINGDWAAASEIYAASDWVTHRYRRFVCDVILSTAHGAVTPSAGLDEAVIEGMSLAWAEIGQAEVARSAQFVNACRWHDFDNWLVNFELGVLSFRRRRYSEADGFLRAAAAAAPPASSFEVNNLRFSNLTWLTGSGLLRNVPVVPDMLECGHAALEADGPEEKKAQIRTFIAMTTGDLSVLAPVFETNNTHEIAESYNLIGDTPRAFEYYGRVISEGYTPRAIVWLARFFYRAQFRQTAAYLVGLILEESWDDFVVLWELAQALGHLQREGGTLDDMQSAHLERLVERLQELCMNEFQHIARAIEFYLENGRVDIAARLLGRADRLAESAEEQLQLARARHAITRGELDVLGIGNLMRARAEAGDRLVRMQIAREFARYGQVRQAREILEEDGVLSGERPLHHIEYVVALQCGQPCLTPEEIRRIVDAASKALGEALSTGTIARYGKYFVSRLAQEAQGFDVVSHTGEDEAEREAAESTWIRLKSDLEKTREDPNVEAERRLLTENVMQLAGLSIHVKYALWENVFRHFERQLETVNRIRPDIDDADTPLKRSRLLLSGARAREVSALWKDYFDPGRNGAAGNVHDALERFREREKELADNWERARRSAMAQPLERLAFRSRMLRALLESIREDERRSDAWPPWLALGEHIERDIESLDEELTRHAEQSPTEAHRHVG